MLSVQRNPNSRKPFGLPENRALPNDNADRLRVSYRCPSSTCSSCPTCCCGCREQLGLTDSFRAAALHAAGSSRPVTKACSWQILISFTIQVCITKGRSRSIRFHLPPQATNNSAKASRISSPASRLLQPPIIKHHSSQTQAFVVLNFST